MTDADHAYLAALTAAWIAAQIEALDAVSD